MREILFRGKRLDTGEWVEGFLLRTNRQNVLIATNVDEYGCGCCITIGTDNFEVDPSTVGQFTGLLDRNGKRIFEGDIITSHTGKIFEVKFGQHEDVEGIGESNGWFASGSYGDLSLGEDWGGHEIIGNIHDNPELLVGGGKV